MKHSVAISLNTPWLEGARIHYTLHGNEPATKSPRYEKPVTVSQISLAVTDGGQHSPCNLANGVQAGFMSE